MFSFSEWLKGHTQSSDESGNAQSSRTSVYSDILKSMDGASEEQLIGFARDYSGYVREAAVRQLSSHRSPGAFLALLDRLNDWVPQVRDAARAGIAPFLCDEYLPLVLHGLHGVMALENRRRADHEQVLDQIRELLRRPSAKRAMLSCVPRSSGKVARFLLDQISANGVQVDGETLDVFAAHRDCIVRLRVVALCRQACAGSGGILDRLQHDGHPRVRREVLSVLWQSSSGGARVDLLKQALSDHAAPVRELAIWYASKIGLDVREWVTRSLADMGMDNKTTVSMLGMVTSLKMREGLPLVRTAVQSPLAMLRAAGLIALIALERESAEVEVTRMLADPSPKVAKLARAAISRGNVALTHQQFMSALDALLRAGDVTRVRVTAALMPIWMRLEGLLLSLQRFSHGPSKEIFVVDLLEWEQAQGRSAIGVGLAERARLTALLVEPDMQELVEEIRPLAFALKTSGLWSSD